MLFALLCVVLTIAAFRSFGGALPLSAEGYRVHVTVPDAANLAPGSDVQIAGVRVGDVVRVRRRGPAALVELELKSFAVPLRRRASATVRTKTLLGEAYLEIAPGSAGAPPIAEGGHLARDRVRETVKVDEALRVLGSRSRRDLRKLLTGLGTAFGDRGADLNSMLGTFGPLTADLRVVLDAVASQERQLGTLIARSADVMRVVGDSEADTRKLIRGGRALLTTTARRDRELRGAVRQTGPFLTELERTAAILEKEAPALNLAASALVPAARRVAPALEEVDRLAPTLSRVARRLPAVQAAARGGLPALRRLATTTGPALADFEATARDLVPFMQLFAVNRDALSILGNVGAVTAGTYVGPGGRVLGYAPGVVTVWNETISGWRKKLPTNRQNPYPRPPDALLDTGRLGVLKSYDCRNLGNRPYLPALGAAPPCLTQGPWTFNGTTAYFPRLRRDP